MIGVGAFKSHEPFKSSRLWLHSETKQGIGGESPSMGGI